jgi:hypothetical protein
VANYTFRDVDPAVAEAVHHAVETFGRVGAHVIEPAFPTWPRFWVTGSADSGRRISKVAVVKDSSDGTPNR